MIEKYLIDALDKEIIRALLLDVIQVKPLPSNSSLFMISEALLLNSYSADITTEDDDQCFYVLEENLVIKLKSIVNKNEGKIQ